MSTAHKAGRLMMWAIVVGLLTVAIDQATKQWALSSLGDGARRPLFGDLLGFELHFNPGAAFSFLTGSTWIFTAVAAVVVAWVSGSTWAAVGVHGGHHMASLVLLAMRTDEGHPVAWVLEGALWLVVAGVVRLLARRRMLPCSTERAISL